MNIAEKQNELVHEIKSWLGTPYHSGAKLKNIGVDCGQLLIAVYEKAGLLERLVEPERVIMFRVPWLDDEGEIHIKHKERIFSKDDGEYVDYEEIKE